MVYNQQFLRVFSLVILMALIGAALFCGFFVFVAHQSGLIAIVTTSALGVGPLYWIYHISNDSVITKLNKPLVLAIGSRFLVLYASFCTSSDCVWLGLDVFKGGPSCFFLPIFMAIFLVSWYETILLTLFFLGFIAWAYIITTTATYRPIIVLDGIGQTAIGLASWLWPLVCFALIGIFTADYVRKAYNELLKKNQQLEKTASEIELAYNQLGQTLSERDQAYYVLEQTFAQLEERNRDLLELSQAVDTTAENERESIAHELHDSVVNPFETQLGLLEAKVTANSLTCTEVAVICQELTEVRRNMRSGLQNLYASELVEYGLYTAIIYMTKRLAKDQPFKLHQQISDELLEQDFHLTIQHAIYRITQQALQNIIKHAQASNVTVYLAWVYEKLVLKVSDDGKGFVVPTDFSKLQAANHNGLAGFAQKVRLLGGRLQIESQLGLGTTILIELPLTTTRVK
jgi:signal transduction histidine kinase